ncbi:MAG TPA: hypothetical protein VGD81_15550 [Opitutaceae bacterium]
MSTPVLFPPLLCEILAGCRADARNLGAIAATCARDLKLPLRTRPAVSAPSVTVTITLHLPADLAATQHPVWCLACRLACFCPHARVSVLVQGATFPAPAQPERRSA